MKLTKLLKGEKVNVNTDTKVVVQLESESVTERVTTHKEIIEPDTKENDWWGTSRKHRNIDYLVKFTNGFTKTYKSIESIDIV